MDGFLFSDGYYIEEAQVDDTTELYSLWLKDGSTYTPAQDLRVKKKIQPGVYILGKKNVIHKTELTSDELILPKGLTESIISEIDKFWTLEKDFKKYNLIHKRGLLLEGAPGTGKSSIITLLMQQVIEKKGVVFIATVGYDLLATLNYLQSTFRKIEPETPIVLVIEDLDKLLSQDEQNFLLNFLDGKMSINHILTIMTANNSTVLPQALLRPSRIDKRFIIEAPSADIRKLYFEHKNIDASKIDDLVTQTKGLTFAELKEVIVSNVIFNNNLEDTVKILKHKIISKDHTINDNDNDIYGL